jgi:hypothetical protein
MSAQKNNVRLGEQVWAKMPKVNAELLTLTYGSLIMQVRSHAFAFNLFLKLSQFLKSFAPFSL